jgi:hypothetical protein
MAREVPLANETFTAHDALLAKQIVFNEILADIIGGLCRGQLFATVAQWRI